MLNLTPKELMPNCRPSVSINDRNSSAHACVAVAFNFDELEFELPGALRTVRQVPGIIRTPVSPSLFSLVLKIQTSRADA
jgi:hypothetical protein